MTSIQALIVGLIQGLTEFLPVSSSAHLKFAKILLGIKSSESSVVFDLCCHVGTLIVVLVYFKQEIYKILHFKNRCWRPFFIGLTPLPFFYFLLKSAREWASDNAFLGVFLCITSSILFLTLWIKPKKKISYPFDVLLIGASQAAALIPGISRSASTLSTARLLGWTAQDAVRYSFLLSIPAITGGTLLEIAKTYSHSNLSSLNISNCLIGFTSALIMGTLVVKPALRFLEKGNFKPFAWYCLIAGIVITIHQNYA
jgi:undecaprenyl-diphosphatase